MNSGTTSSALFRAALAGWALLSLPPLLHSVDESYGPIIAEEIVSGLDSPVYAATPPHDSRHLFIVQKGGSIRVFDREEKSLLSGSLLTLSPITTNSERGFLGLAFHPDFAENRRFYVNFTDGSGATVVRRYRMRDSQPPYALESGSALDLLTVPQPYPNHNAGWIGFGPVDGYLYVALGDGGSANDPLENGQNKNTLLGSMLRIEVDNDHFPGDSARNYAIPPGNPFVGKDGRDEIWAYGLRNPWRNSFDRETGDLWIADVGQNSREEINFQPAGDPGGANYGWRLREGTIATPTGGVGGSPPPGNVDPVYEYDFSDGPKAIAGGYVYRGAAMPQLHGHYFFADYVADFIRSFRYAGSGMINGNEVEDWTARFGNISNPASFGESAEGDIFIVSLSGKIYQITQSPWYLWRNRHFSDDEIRDMNTSGPEASPQGDGIPNLLKYALDVDPTKPGGRLPIDVTVESIDGENYLVLTVERSPDATDVTLLVEAASAPGADGTWSDGVVVIEDGPARLRVRDAIPVPSADRRFLRLRAIAAF